MRKRNVVYIILTLSLVGGMSSFSCAMNCSSSKHTLRFDANALIAEYEQKKSQKNLEKKTCVAPHKIFSDAPKYLCIDWRPRTTITKKKI